MGTCLSATASLLRSAPKSASYVLAALLLAACAPKFNKTGSSSVDAVSAATCDSVMSPGGSMSCPSHVSIDNSAMPAPDSQNLVIAGYGNNKIHVVCNPNVGSGAGAGALCSNVSGGDVLASGGSPGTGGSIYTLAGSAGYPVNSGDGGTALNAGMYKPTATAVDSFGNVILVVPTYHTVRVVCMNLNALGVCANIAGAVKGHVYNLAGPSTATIGSSTNLTHFGYRSPATLEENVVSGTAQLNLPSSVAIDSSNNVIIADTNSNRIRVVCQATNAVHGVGVCAFANGGGAVVGGNIYTIAGGAGSACAGTTSAIGDGCAASAAVLSNPRSVAVDSSNNIAVGEGSGSTFRVRMICSVNGGFCSGAIVNGFGILTNAGGSTINQGFIYAVVNWANASGGSGGNQHAWSSSIGTVYGVGFDSSNNLFASDPIYGAVNVVCAGTGGICAHTNSSLIDSSGGPGATPYFIYQLADSGSASDTTIGETGAVVGSAGVPFNFATHALGYYDGRVIVSDRDNNVVRLMAY